MAVHMRAKTVYSFLKGPSAKAAAALFKLSRNQLRILTGLKTRHCHFEGHPCKLGQVSSPDVTDVSGHLFTGGNKI
jgi:hypothetical protein